MPAARKLAGPAWIGLLCLLAAPAAADSVYHDPQGRFRITPPPHYLVTLGGTEGAEVKFAGPSYGEFAPTLTLYAVDVRNELKGRKLDDYVAEARAGLMANLQKLQVISQRRYRIAGAPAYEMEYKHSDRGRDLTVVQTIVFAHGTAFVLTGTTLDLVAYKDLPDLKGAIESFRATAPKPSKKPR